MILSLLVQAIVFDMAYELIDYFTEVGVLNRAFLQTGTERDESSLGFLPLTDLCYTQQYIFTWLVHLRRTLNHIDNPECHDQMLVHQVLC